MSESNEMLDTCWFRCGISLNIGKVGFSTEFDCWVHEKCICEQPDDNPEKRIMLKEFNLK